MLLSKKLFSCICLGCKSGNRGNHAEDIPNMDEWVKRKLIDWQLEEFQQVFEGQHTLSESKKSTEENGAPYFCATTHISSEKHFDANTFIEYDIDERVEMKKEIMQEEESYQMGQHCLFSEGSQLGGQFTSSKISSSNNSGVQTPIEYDIDGTLDIKEEIMQDHVSNQMTQHSLFSGRNQLYEELIAAEISSVNTSDAKTLIKYAIDGTLDIKKEIKLDEDSYQMRQHSLFTRRNQYDEQCSPTEMSSVNKSCPQTLIEYDMDETMDIKEEIMQDHSIKKWDSSLCTGDGKEADNLAVINKVQKSRHKSGKKYNCDKCTCSYTLKRLLNHHKKFECDVKPQFSYKLCGRKSHPKYSMSGHVDLVHSNSNSRTLQTRFNCDKCPQSYTFVSSLNRHKRVEHAAVKPLFICDICGHKTKRKCNLAKHITSRHLQVSKSRHYCDKCSRSYSWLSDLTNHKRVEHGAVKPKFICSYCGKNTNRKSSLARHITSRHLHTSEKRHYCDECSRSYAWLSLLKNHKKLNHAEVKPQFVCDYCGHKTNLKFSLSKHINSRHFYTSKRRHFCDKCSLSYTLFDSLTRHKRLKHAVVAAEPYSVNFTSF